MYLCKKWKGMNRIRKWISVFLLALFVAYSGGFGFSLHHCDHCRTLKIYLLQHPACCGSSDAESSPNQGADEACEMGACCGQEASREEEDCLAGVASDDCCHTECCGISEFKYFKIQSDYVGASYDKRIVTPTDIPFIAAISASQNLFILSVVSATEIALPKHPPQPTGGNTFLLFSHQLLFYS
jgi:hypothetical protein